MIEFTSHRLLKNAAIIVVCVGVSVFLQRAAHAPFVLALAVAILVLMSTSIYFRYNNFRAQILQEVERRMRDKEKDRRR